MPNNLLPVSTTEGIQKKKEKRKKEKKEKKRKEFPVKQLISVTQSMGQAIGSRSRTPINFIGIGDNRGYARSSSEQNERGTTFLFVVDLSAAAGWNFRFSLWPAEPGTRTTEHDSVQGQKTGPGARDTRIGKKRERIFSRGASEGRRGEGGGGGGGREPDDTVPRIWDEMPAISPAN